MIDRIKQNLKYCGLIIVGVISLFLIAPESTAQEAAPPIVWTRSLVNYARFSPEVIVRSKDSGYVIAGNDLDTEPTSLILTKIDERGNILWESRHTFGYTNSLSDLIVTLDGHYVATGYTYVSGEYQSFISYLDQDGNLLWSKVVESPNSGRGLTLCQLSSDLFVMFRREIPSSFDGPDGISTYFDRNGEILRQKRYHFGSYLDLELKAVQPLENNQCIVVGEMRGWGFHTHPVTGVIMRLDEQGDTLWTQQHVDTSSVMRFTSIEQLNDSSFLVSGYGHGEMLFMCITADGEKLWESTFLFLIYATDVSAAITLSGGFVASASQNTIFGTYAKILRFDAQGTYIWDNLVGKSNEEDFLGIDVCVADDGSYILLSSRSTPYDSPFEFCPHITAFAPDSTDLREIGKLISSTIMLHPVYPNPFNSVAQFRLNAYQSGQIEVDILNILGQRVKSVYGGYLDIGYHDFSFDLQGFASGIYLVRALNQSDIQIQIAILIK